MGGVGRSLWLGILVGVAWLLLPPTALAAPGDLDPGFGEFGLLEVDQGGHDELVDLEPDSVGGVIAASLVVPFGCDHPCGEGEGKLVRLDPEGGLDPMFGPNGEIRLPVSAPFPIAVQSTGDMVVSLSDDELAGISPSGAENWRRLVGTSGGPNVAPLHVLADDGFARVTLDAGTHGHRVERRDAAGDLVAAFGSGGTVVAHTGSFDLAEQVEPRAGGDLLVAGRSRTSAGWEGTVVRITAEGAVDTGFAGEGVLRIPMRPEGPTPIAAVSPADELLVARQPEYSYVSVERYDGTTGDRDSSYGTGGEVRVRPGANPQAVVPLADGGAVVMGWEFRTSGVRTRMVRLSERGRVDRSFGIDGEVITPGYRGIDAEQIGDRLIVAGVDPRGPDDLVFASYQLGPGRPDADADGVRNGRDRCPFVHQRNRAGCPIFRPQLGIRYFKDPRGFRVWVKRRPGNPKPCLRHLRVTLTRSYRGKVRFERRKRLDRRSHLFRLRRPGPGRYRARAPRRLQPLFGKCRAAKSRVVRR